MLEDQNVDTHLGVLQILKKQSGDYQNENVDGHYQVINTNVRTMI